MPYKSVAELPPPVKDNIPAEAQKIFMAAYNSAWEQHGKEDNAEMTCTKIAWGAVKTKFKQSGDKWVAKESAKDTLQTKYSELIQEIGRKHAAADEARIKQIINICQELLAPTGSNGGADNEGPESETTTDETPTAATPGNNRPDNMRGTPNQDDGTTNESAKITEAIKEIDSCIAWLKEQAETKTEDGTDYPAAAYAYVPDKDKPSTWKLRLWEDPTKKVTKAQLGRAAAAFSPGGFRGNKVEIPTADVAAVKRSIRAEYKKLDVADDDIPKWVKEAETRQLLADYTPLTEATLNKNGEGLLTIIQPGFNVGRGRFYPKEVIARDLGIFEGAKMYADHPTDAEDKARPERSIKDWVATLGKPFVNAAGAAQAPFTVVEPWFESKLAKLRDKNMLKELGVSINAIGSASDQVIEGTKTKLIERLIRARSVDFVTEPGAGGTVNVFEAADPTVDIDLIDAAQIKERRPDIVRLLEAEIEARNKQEANKKMELEQEVKTLKESNATLTTENTELKVKITEADKAKAKAEAQAVIKEAIAKATLPDAAKAKLTEQFKEAEKADGLDAAIKAESDYIAKITEAGKVRGMGATQQPTNDGSLKLLRESFKKSNPEWTEAQLDAATKLR